MTGVEGYVESAASGLLAAVHMARKLEKKPQILLDNTTVCGALSAHISGAIENFQPMNANFGILSPLEKVVRDKKQRYALLAERALKNIQDFAKKSRD